MTPPALDRVIATLPREGPGGPPPDRARRQAPAPVDRRGRLAGRACRRPSRTRRRSRERLAWMPRGRRRSPARRSAPARSDASARRRRALTRSDFAAIPPPEKSGRRRRPRFSPDGTTLAFTARTRRARSRASGCGPSASPAAHPVAGHRGRRAAHSGRPTAGSSVTSPAGELRRRSTRPAGPPLTICDAARGVGGTWNRDGTIVFGPTPTSPLFRGRRVGRQAR